SDARVQSPPFLRDRRKLYPRIISLLYTLLLLPLTILCYSATFHAAHGAESTEKEITMNSDTLKGQWKQLKGKVQEAWGDLTDDEWEQMRGSRDQFVGKLQERYGYARERAEREADDFARANQWNW